MICQNCYHWSNADITFTKCPFFPSTRQPCISDKSGKKLEFELHLWCWTSKMSVLFLKFCHNQTDSLSIIIQFPSHSVFKQYFHSYVFSHMNNLYFYYSLTVLLVQTSIQFACYSGGQTLESVIDDSEEL